MPETPPFVGSGSHIVREGEDIASIAFRYGVDPEQLWNHGDNAELREHRTPEILRAGDRVAIPRPAERPSFAVTAGGQHRFRAEIPKHAVHFTLMDDGEPRRNVPFTAIVDGLVSSGSTDAEGNLTLEVRPTTRSATLVLHETVDDREVDEMIELQIGALDPLSTVSGVQGRLRALGYPTGPIDGELGPKTRHAIEEFQRTNGLTMNGEITEETRERLGSAHAR